MRSPSVQEDIDDDDCDSRRRMELVTALLQHNADDVESDDIMMMGVMGDVNEEEGCQHHHHHQHHQRPLDLCQELLQRIKKEESITNPSKTGGGSGSEGTTKTTTTTTVRAALGNNISSNQVSDLSQVLSTLMSEDRIDRAELMPGTYDEIANIEAASDSQMALTLTRTSLLAGQLYACLLTKPGALGSSLVQLPALSALSALLKRWNMECCGRESQALQQQREEENKKNRRRSGKRNGSRNSQPLKRSRGYSQQESDDDSCSSSSSSDEEDDLLVVGEDEEKQQQQLNNALTPRDLVKLGLEIAKYISSVPLSTKEVWNWSCDERDTLMDIVTCVLGTSSALLATTTTTTSGSSSGSGNNKMVDKSIVAIGNDVITEASKSLSECCCCCSISLLLDDDDGTSTSNLALTKRLDTTNAILKGLMPLITMKLNLPKGQAGNSNAASNASKILANLIRNVSRDVTTSSSSSLSSSSSTNQTTNEQQGVLMKTPAKTPSRHTTNNNENNLKTPMSTGGRSRARVSLNGGGSALLSPPKLKTPTTCNRSVMVKQHRQQQQQESENQGNNNNDKKMHPLLRLVVAMLMTMLSQKELEKASTRTNVAQTLIECLPNLPPPERLRFIKFLIHISTSKVAFHRQASTELIGQVLVQEWFWNEHNDDESVTATTTTAAAAAAACTASLRPINLVNGNSNDDEPQRSSLGSYSAHPVTLSTGDGEDLEGEGEERSLPGALLAALELRMVDRLPAIRVSSANALANVFRELLEAPYSQAAAKAQLMERAVSSQAFLLLKRLRSRCISDDKATVRKASLGAYVELLLVVEQCPGIVSSINDDDLATLEQLCCDTSILTRKAAAEALTRLLDWYSSPRNDPKKNDVANNRGFNDSIMLISSSKTTSSSNMQQALENAWTRAVLPLALDSESSCANKAVELFDHVVLDPLLNNDIDDDSDLEDSACTTSAGRCDTPWRILANVTSGGEDDDNNNNRSSSSSSSLGVNHSSGRVDALRAVLKHKAINNDTTSSSFLGLILKIIHQTCLRTLEADGNNDLLFEPHVQAQRSGVWCLFNALLGINKVPSKIMLIFKRKKIRLNFLVECWEKLLDLYTASTTANKSNDSIERLLASMKHCLTVISNLTPAGFDGEIGTKFSRDLERLLSNFSLPVDIIGAAVRALVAVRWCSANNSEHDARIACTTMIRSLFTSCEDEISTQIGTFNNNGVTAEAESKLVRVVHTTGELCLVGFSESDEGTSGPPDRTTDSTTATSDQPLRGTYERPSSRLVDLIQFFLPHTLPSSDGNVKSPHIVRAHAFLTLGKMCLRDEKLASSSLNILARELHESMGGDDGTSSIATASNALLILGDLCVRYTNLVDRFLPVMACCIQSGINTSGDGGGVVIAVDDPAVANRKKQFAMIRTHAIRLLSSLLIQDYIKWRGLLFHRFLVATCDEDEGVAYAAKMVLIGPLLAKQPKLFANNFVESMLVLNRCTAHPIYESAAALGDGGSGIAVGFDGINLSGEVGRARRHLMYECMLLKMTDEEKISVTARIAKEVLGNALVEGSALNRACSGVKDAASATESPAEKPAAASDEGAYNVLRDAFAVLSSKSIRVSRGGGSNSADRDEEGAAVPGGGTNANEAVSQRQRVVVAKGRLLSKLSRKHLIEIIIPILVNLKAQLQSKCSPLQDDLMRYLVNVYGMYKIEVKELLSNDPNLLQEIEYEARQFKQKEKQKQRSSSIISAAAAAD